MQPNASKEEAFDRTAVASFLKSRSEESFRALYRAHNPRQLALARKFVRQPGTAEDAIQEMWLRATRLLPNFGWRSSLRSWLTGILLNVIRELDRTAGRSCAGPANEEEPVNGGLEPLESLALVQALQSLPTGFKTVLALHDIEGFTHAEISDALGIDCGTSKSQLARAREQLRRKLIELQ